MKPLTNEAGEDDLIRIFILQELNFGIKLTNHIHKVFVNINKILRNSLPANNTALSTITDIINHQVSLSVDKYNIAMVKIDIFFL